MHKTQCRASAAVTLHACAAPTLALALMAVLPGAAGAQEIAGAVASVQPQVTSSIAGAPAQDLARGARLVQGQSILTGADGRTHLLFVDNTGTTLGPSSRLDITRWTYSPVRRAGELRMRLLGIMQLVGGDITEADIGRLLVDTPLGTVEGTGAIILIDSRDAAQDSVACLIFGKTLRGTHSRSGARAEVTANEQCLRFTPDGRIEDFPLAQERAWLDRTLTSLSGTDRGPTPAWRGLPQTASSLPLVADMHAVLTAIETQNFLDEQAVASDAAVDSRNRQDTLRTLEDGDARVIGPGVDLPPGGECRVVCGP